MLTPDLVGARVLHRDSQRAVPACGDSAAVHVHMHVRNMHVNIHVHVHV